MGQTDVTLPTGSYYFDKVEFVGSSKVTIQGAVALYIDGRLQTVGQDRFNVPAGSTLDLYVSGGVEQVGSTSLAAGDPGSFRLYVGGTTPVLVGVGQQRISGLIYAPTADLKFVGDTEIDGAVFAKTLDGVGRFTIRHASVTPPPPGVCPGGDGGTPPTDAGTPPSPPPLDGGLACNAAGNYCNSNNLACCPGLTCVQGLCAAPLS